MGHGGHLSAVVTLVDQPAQVDGHAAGQRVQLLGREVAQLQPLQVQNVLLVVGHLEIPPPHQRVA